MKELTCGKDTLFVGEGNYEEIFREGKSYPFTSMIPVVLFGLRIRRHFNNLMKAYDSSQQNTGRYILIAHGGERNREWVFEDGRKRPRIQDWIDSVDGKAPTIILYCCNVGKHTISSRESIIVHSTKATMRGFNWLIGTNLRIYFPGEGYLEHNTPRMKELTKQLRASTATPVKTS